MTRHAYGIVELGIQELNTKERSAQGGATLLPDMGILHGFAGVLHHKGETATNTAYAVLPALSMYRRLQPKSTSSK